MYTGSTIEDYDRKSHCYPGYQGILCTQCEIGYASNSSFQCGACPELWKNMALMLEVLFLSVVVIVVFIASMRAKKLKLSVYLKILTNHLQLIVITLNFDLDWPTQVSQVKETAKPLADVSSRIISFDCFLG